MTFIYAVGRRVLWWGVVILAAIGIAAGVLRIVSVLTGGLDYSVFQSVFPSNRVQEAVTLDRWFLGYRLLALLHVVPGILFLALAPLQFWPTFRNQHLRLHRWSGRLLIAAALVVGVSGLTMGAIVPFGGPIAATAVFAAGVFFLLSLMRAYVAVRRRDFERHREWMIRMFSIGLGIATVRIIAVPLLALTEISLNTAAAISFWSGWLITLGAAEYWIRHTRITAIEPGYGVPIRMNNGSEWINNN